MSDHLGPPMRSAFSDDPEIQELLQLFVAEMPERVDALAKAMSEEARDDLARIAHQLKGSGGSYGFAPISDAARVLEDALREATSDAEQIRQAIEDLVDCCSRAIV